MRHEFGSIKEPGVLVPSVPLDIGAQSQRQRILHGMTRSCAEKTFARTTIADIVKFASISRATFYKHFDSKQECFEAAVDAFAAELEAVVTDAAAGVAGPDAVRDGAAALLEALAASPAHARLLLIEAPAVDPAAIGRCRGLVLAALRAQWPPVSESVPAGADAAIAFGRAQVLIATYVAGDRASQLPTLLPEVVYIALLPFLGQAEALGQARLGQ